MPATSTKPPEQVRILVLARCEELAVCSNYICRDEVVQRAAVFAHHPSQATAQRQTADACCFYISTRRRKTKDLQFVIQLAPSYTGFHSRRTQSGIDVNSFHRPQVNHDPFITQANSRDV